MATNHSTTTRPLVVTQEPYILNDSLDEHDGEAHGVTYFCPDAAGLVELHIPIVDDYAPNTPTVLLAGMAIEDVGALLDAAPALAALAASPTVRGALADWQAERRAAGLPDALSTPDEPAPPTAPLQLRPFDTKAYFEDALLTIPPEERAAWRAMAREIAGLGA